MHLFRFGFGRAAPREQCLVIDVGSSARIRSLLFEETAGGRRVVSKHQYRLPMREKDVDRIAAINEELRRLIFQIVRDNHRVPERVLIGLGSTYTRDVVGTAVQIRSKPDTPVTEREIQSALQEFIAANSKTEDWGQPYVLACLVPFFISVDGYRVDSLDGMLRGKKIEIAVLATYIRERYWPSLLDLRSVWGGLTIRFISNQAAIASLLIEELGIQNALVIKISSETTEVALIAENAIQFTGQFAQGGNAITERIAQALAIPTADAERMKCQLAATTLPGKTASRVNEAIHNAILDWLKELTLLLSRDERMLLPQDVYVIGGGALLEELPRMIAKEPWYANLTFADTLTVKRLNAEEVLRDGFRNSVNPLSGPEEVALVALAEYAARSVPIARAHELPRPAEKKVR